MEELELAEFDEEELADDELVLEAVELAPFEDAADAVLPELDELDKLLSPPDVLLWLTVTVWLWPLTEVAPKVLVTGS